MKKPRIAVIGLTGQSLLMGIDRFHQSGETLAANCLQIEPGGKGYNQSYACLKLGAHVDFLSAVGDDYYADVAKKHFSDAGGNGHFIKKAKQKTAVGCVLVDQKGNNQVTVFHGATQYLTKEDILLFEDAIAQSDIVLLQLEIPLETTKMAIKVAKKHNKKVILNPAPARNFDEEILHDVWLLTPNEIEAKTIFKIDMQASLDELIATIIQSQIKRIVVTLGEKGVVLICDKTIVRIPAITVETVDTTGAGDQFNAMLAYALGKNISLQNAVQLATKIATLSTMRQGVLNAFMSYNDIKDIIYKSEEV